MEHKLATRFFHARECEVLAALEERARRENFFQLWTRKEAILKARGDGLWNGLDFDASEVLNGWTQLDLSIREGFAGALAVKMWEVEAVLWGFLGTERLLSRSI